MWTPKSLIAEAATELELSVESFRLLDELESSRAYSTITSHFLNVEDSTFWWEVLKLPSQSWKPDSDAFEQISSIVPDPEESIWFVPQDDPENPIFETSTTTAIQVIRQCAAFEYAICSRKLKWMIIENHHDYIVAVGREVIERMRRLKESAGL